MACPSSRGLLPPDRHRRKLISFSLFRVRQPPIAVSKIEAAYQDVAF